MQITVTITGLDQAEERLSALGAGLHDFTDTLEGLGKSLVLFYGDTVFNSQGAALNGEWTPLSEPYASWKSDHYPGRGILDRGGTMKNSFRSEVTPDSLFISNDAPYFPFHQLGTGEGTGRGHNIPARPMLGVNSRVEALIKTAIEADIKAKIESTSI